ncbi:MAG: transporter substrate-binding domain-containing protein, partial [Alphaproteobacteria bacterium]
MAVVATVALGFLSSALPQAEAEEAFLTRSLEKRTDDLGEMLDRRVIRALVTYDKTKFFFIKGAPRGFEFELLEQYEEFVNRETSKDELATQIVYIPVPFARLLEALRDGEGDIAAAGLTITPERENIVDFTDPYLPDVAEVIVAARHVDGLERLEDLSGRKVYVRPESSHEQHLRRLNETLEANGLAPVEIVEADDKLAAEDVLEMVNAGVVDLAVADDFVARIWSGVLTQMVVREDLVLNSGGRIAWAVRKENPELLASLNAFIAQNKKGTLTGNILFKRYFENDKFIRNPLAADEKEKFERLKSVLIQYSDRYGLDWLAVGAQA